ncbi:MAG: ABC transporter permease subunit [Cyanobacteria bacterium REEB459]|nr:ABC transporter permease subunit [Cyanobacteria bacterium REEB459]
MVLDRRRLPSLGRGLLLAGLVIYLLLPIAAVLLYAFSTRWTSHLLPDGYTASHWLQALADPRLVAVMLRTLGLALLVTLLDILLIVPAIYWQWIYNPRIRPHLELTAAIPFVLPYVVIAFGILSLSGQFLPAVQGTVGLLALSHGVVAFPFFYWAVDNAMAAADVALLNEVAKTCGASPWRSLVQVILPNISVGIATGSMLVFAVSFNEFALVQILVGARYETVSLYSLDLLTGTNADFNKLAVITMFTFVVVFTLSALSVYLNRGQGQTRRLMIGSRSKA